MTDPQNEPVPSLKTWRIDHTIPIAFLLGLAIQTGCFIWYAAKLDARVQALEASDVRMLAERAERRAAVDAKTEALSKNGDRLTRLEAATDFIVQSLRRIEQKLDAQGRP